MQVTDSVSFAPAIINVEGKTKLDRQMSVVRHASAAAQLALVNAKGKMGVAIREGVAKSAHDKLAQAAATGNYRPIAEYIAATFGEPMVITTRAAFESLPDQFEARIFKVKMTKSGGYTTDKKTGLQVENAAHKLALRLKAECVEIIARAGQIAAESKAAREAAKAITA